MVTPLDVERLPPFDPHPWLRSGHAMTLAAAFARRRVLIGEGEQRSFRTDEETRIVARCNWQAERGAPVVVLVHGMCGSADSGYMIGTADKAFAAGFSTVRMNIRNCGGTEHLTPTLYHAALTTDVRAVVEELAWTDGAREIYVAGFSLGGNIVLRLLAEWSEQAPGALAGAAAISAPIDLEGAAQSLESGGLNSLYTRRFIRDLGKVYRRKAALYPDRYDVERLDGLRTLREFDDRITAHYCGFGTAERYYTLASSLRALPAIEVPTLLLGAADDSLAPVSPLRRPEVTENPSLHVKMTARGGHLSFFGRGPAHADQGIDPDRWWAENRVVEWFRRLSCRRRT